MHSLFDALLAQHARQLTAVRCAHSTIAQLHRYFEEIVLENNLSALVIESLPSVPKRSQRQIARVRDLARGRSRTFFFVGRTDEIVESDQNGSFKGCEPVFLSHAGPDNREHFVVIADARFSALLATVRSTNDGTAGEDEVVWTFEPDVVYSALEYLMARVQAEYPYHAEVFGDAVRTSMPKATSLQLTLSVTTKLAHLLQEQAGREIAVNRIATAIRESLELGVILQKTVTEVGAALNVACCALRVEDQTEVQALSYSYFADDEKREKLNQEHVNTELDELCSAMATSRKHFIRDGSEMSEDHSSEFPLAIVPLIFHERFVGALEVIDDNPLRTWQDNEILLLRTVANQVAVAINHADLYAQMQQQALTDALTGCFNRRSFEMHLDREMQLMTRLNEPVALMMLDLDWFKQLNDTVGHDAGDDALRWLADCFHRELRAVDTAARFGGDEFALILPQAHPENAMLVGERLRKRIEEIEIAGFGKLTASIGIAVFPQHAASRHELVSAADMALYSAKRAGRNRVAIFDPDTDRTAAQLLASKRTVNHPEQTERVSRFTA